MLSFMTDTSRKGSTRTLYWQHENHAAIRQGDWKLVTTNDRTNDRWELYNLSADRSETEDLIDKHPDIARNLKEKWLKWAKDANVLPFPENREKAKPVPWPPRPWPEEAG